MLPVDLQESLSGVWKFHVEFRPKKLEPQHKCLFTVCSWIKFPVTNVPFYWFTGSCGCVTIFVLFCSGLFQFSHKDTLFPVIYLMCLHKPDRNRGAFDTMLHVGILHIL